jgi:hypothetical protein
MAWAKTRLDTARYSSAETRRGVMDWNTFRSTHAASTNRAAPSFKKLSTRCFASTSMQPSATFIWQMSRLVLSMPTISLANDPGDQLFRRADGSLEDGRFKSYLHRH